MTGTEDITQTGGTYNPDACSATPSACTTTYGFMTTTFTGGTYTVNDWNFEYSSADNSLTYHHWQDKYNPGQGIEQFVGDIANE